MLVYTGATKQAIHVCMCVEELDMLLPVQVLGSHVLLAAGPLYLGNECWMDHPTFSLLV